MIGLSRMIACAAATEVLVANWNWLFSWATRWPETHEIVPQRVCKRGNTLRKNGVTKLGGHDNLKKPLRDVRGGTYDGAHPFLQRDMKEDNDGQCG
jgi:hypothetical protein